MKINLIKFIAAIVATVSLSPDCMAKELTLGEFKQIFFNGDNNNPDFKQIDKPAILYFYADWCGPCKLFRKRVEKYILENPNVDYFQIGESNRDTTGNYLKTKFFREVIRLKFYPTVVVFDGKGSFFSFSGVVDQEVFDAGIDAFLEGYYLYYSQEFRQVALFGKERFLGHFSDDFSNGRGTVISDNVIFLGEVRNNRPFNGIYFDENFHKHYVAGGEVIDDPGFVQFKDKDSGLYGICYKTGDTLLPPVFEKTGYWREGTLTLTYEGTEGAIDEAGNIVIPFEQDKLGQFQEGMAYYQTLQNDTVYSGYIDKFNNVVFSYSGESGIYKADFTASRAIINIGEGFESKYIYVDKKGNNICGDLFFSWAESFDEGVALVAIKSDEGSLRYGFINWDGSFMVYPKYRAAHSFDNGKALVLMDDRWAYIDLEGQVLRYLTDDEIEELML